MKMKTFSKLMAIALMAIMTTCLSSCEDERTIPVQGSGISDDSVHHNLSPNPPAETESKTENTVEGYIRGCGVGYDDEVGEYIWVTAFVTSHYSEKLEAWQLANVVIYDDDGWGHSWIPIQNPPDKSYDLGMLVKPETPTMVTWAFRLPADTDSIVIELSNADYYGAGDDGILDSTQLYLTEE